MMVLTLSWIQLSAKPPQSYLPISARKQLFCTMASIDLMVEEEGRKRLKSFATVQNGATPLRVSHRHMKLALA
jgi:hypothetical protein